MAITVRKGNPQDLPAIFEMINELAIFEKAPDSVKNSLQQMQEEKKSFDFFVAENGGKIIDYALYFFAYYTWVGKSLHLDDLYVRPDLRGRKVGSMLARKVFGVAKREGCKRVRLQVLNWNSNAISIYKEWGGLISTEWINCDFDERKISRFLRKR